MGTSTNKWLNTDGAADMLGIPEQKLLDMRAEKPYEGPPYFMRGKFVFYEAQDLEDWLMAAGNATPDNSEGWKRVVPDAPPPNIDSIYKDFSTPPVEVPEEPQGEVIGKLSPVDPNWKRKYRQITAFDSRDRESLEGMDRPDQGLISELSAQGRIGPNGEILEPRTSQTVIPSRGDMLMPLGVAPDPISASADLPADAFGGVGLCPPSIVNNALDGTARRNDKGELMTPHRDTEGRLVGGAPLPRAGAGLVDSRGNPL